MSNCPFFSIILPVYNVSSYLEQCLDSIRNQTLENIEIICINDGSTDSSREILRDYQKRDMRIVILDTKNLGPSAARNLGFSQARGEYVLFMDSDDFIDAELCSYLYEQSLKYKSDITVYDAYPFPENSPQWLARNLVVRSRFYEHDSIAALIYENGATPFVWRNVFRRQFLLEHQLSFLPDVFFGEDLIFQFMSFPAAERILFLEKRLYHYRWKRQGSAMFNAENNLGQKYKHHIRSVNILAEYWENHGLLSKYGKEFFIWTISFLGADLHHYTGSDKQELLCEAKDLVEKYQLNAYANELSEQQTFYYSNIMKGKNG